MGELEVPKKVLDPKAPPGLVQLAEPMAAPKIAMTQRSIRLIMSQCPQMKQANDFLISVSRFCKDLEHNDIDFKSPNGLEVRLTIPFRIPSDSTLIEPPEFNLGEIDPDKYPIRPVVNTYACFARLATSLGISIEDALEEAIYTIGVIYKNELEVVSLQPKSGKTQEKITSTLEGIDQSGQPAQSINLGFISLN